MWHLRQAEGAAAIKAVAAAATTAAAPSIGGSSIVARRNWADCRGLANGRSRHIASLQNAIMRRCYQSIPAWRRAAGTLVVGST